mmetsp:Transcript_6135/g.9817  ORF Transcript_6135/g.9817 Transcript_6135/m.9817 type:complete len:105 (-) Transcript_6135:178-492(-)
MHTNGETLFHQQEQSFQHLHPKYQIPSCDGYFFFLWPSNEVFALCCKKHVATDPRWKSALHKSLFPPRASIAFGAYSKSWMFLSKSEASIPSDGGSKTKLAPIT